MAASQPKAARLVASFAMPIDPAAFSGIPTVTALKPLSRAGATTIISNGGNGHDGTGASKLSQDVVQVLSQLSPIMEQLAGVNLKGFLQDISKLPGAVVKQSSTVVVEPTPGPAPKP